VPGGAAQAFDFSGFTGGLVGFSDTLGTISQLGAYTAPAATGSTQTDTVVVTGFGNTGETASTSVTIPTAATTATLTGPTAGNQGDESTPFTVTLNHPAPGGGVVVNLASNGSGDVFRLVSGGGNVTTAPIASGATTATFLLVPGSAGARQVSITTTPTLTPSGSPITYTSTAVGATSYTLTNASPSSGPPNAASGNFTVQLNGIPSPSAVITPQSSVGGDAFTPASLTVTDNATHTFVLNGSATGGARTITVTHTGGGFSGDPAGVVYTVVAATAYTLTNASPSSGYVRNSSANFTVQLNAVPSTTCVITPISSVSGDTFTPPSMNVSDAAAHTFVLNLSATTGARTITVTHTGGGFSGEPAGVTYTGVAQTLSVSPASVATGSSGTVLTMTGGGSAWTSGSPGSPIFTFSAGSVTGQTIASATSATDTYTAPSIAQTVTVTDPSTGATATITVASAYYVLAVAPYGAAYTGLALQYAIYNSDGTLFQARSTTNVAEIATKGIYEARVLIPYGFIGVIVWDAPTGLDPYIREIDVIDSAMQLIAGIDAKTRNLPAQPASANDPTILDAVSSGDPGNVASQNTFPKKLMALYRRFYGPSSLNTQLKTYADNGTTVNSTQAVTDDGTTQTYGKAT
jgi:hypothetical protein